MVGDTRETLQRRFRLFIAISASVLVMEAAGGLLTNSLALLSDSVHVLTDLLAFILAYFSVRLARRGPTEQFTFGFYRAEILAAVANGMILIFVTLYLAYQAYARFLSPQPIDAGEMLVISSVGLLANAYMVTRMRGQKTHNLNVRGAYLHVLSDAISSVGVVGAGALILVTGNYIFDPLVSAVVSIFILVSSVRLIRRSAYILMEASPENLDLKRLSDDIKSIPGVREVHDVHVWSISSDVYALSSHILLDTRSVDEINAVIARINEMLKTKYGITHSVIQSECERCADLQAGQKDGSH